MRTRTLGTYSSHMPVKILKLERQERDETRNMAKQTGVHDVIDVIVPALMLPRLCQAASMCCTRTPSTRAARRLGRSWPCAGCAGVTRGASISDGCLWGDDDVLPFIGVPLYKRWHWKYRGKFELELGTVVSTTGILESQFGARPSASGHPFQL